MRFQNNENTMEHSDSDLIVTGAMTILLRKCYAKGSFIKSFDELFENFIQSPITFGFGSIDHKETKSDQK